MRLSYNKPHGRASVILGLFLGAGFRGCLATAGASAESALTEVTSLPAFSVLAFYARHIGLEFLAGQADNDLGSALRLTPRADSPAVQLGTGCLIVGVTARFSPSSHVHKARALGVMSYSHRIKGAFKG